MPDSTFVKKAAVRYFVLGLFVFNILVLAGGLLAVEKYVADQASVKAAKLASRTAEATRYNANRQTCLTRTLVDNQLSSIRRIIKIQRSIIADAGRPAKVRATASANVRSQQQTIDGLLKFRATYGTIPPNYNCRLLPKDPPPLATNGGAR